MHKCTICGELKTEAGFYRRQTGALRRECKVCVRAKSALWAKRNPDRKAASSRAWARANPDKQKAAVRAWTKRNYAHVRERNRKWALAHPETARTWRQANKEHVAEKGRRWQAANREKLRARARERYAANCEKERQRCQRWYADNKAWSAAKTMHRHARKLQATPSWANRFFIKEIYDLAARRTAMRCGGVNTWHVDHIVPLKSRLVCGLHVEHNLQVIPGIENSRKSNRTWPDMPGVNT